MERSGSEIIRIIFTGPESTGKTLLSMEMAARFNGIYMPEYARDYILGLKRKYVYEDVLHIAGKQVEMMNDFSHSEHRLLIADTYLVITKIWLKRVFEKYPSWIDEEIQKSRDALYLLCKPDIPWEPDAVRENGGEMREVLFNEYLGELKNAGLNYSFVEGFGASRTACAFNEITNFLKK